MQWRKLGRIYCPTGEQWWARSHAMVPSPLQLSEDLLRLYVSHADASIVSRVGYIDLSLNDPTRVISRSPEPIFDIGEPGTFDDNGVIACGVVRANEELRMYYSGYQLQRKIPYSILGGLATSTSHDGPFRRHARVPVLDRIGGELYIRSAPFVLYDQGRWRMWYIGGSIWVRGGDKLFPSYSVRYLESDDGLSWPGPSKECLVPRRPDEIGCSRPFVVRTEQGYLMWYSIRKISGYALGFAMSADGLHWTRQDEAAGIERSADGWDSEMICYAAVVPTATQWFLFYNGNNYGRTGVGVAVAQPSEVSW
jgi:predicted GH43/DUF377 family glycosyl hydrolase